MKQGHDEKYYQTLDQRFLGEDSFIQKVAQRTEAKEIEIKEKRASFAPLLEAISAVRKVDSKALLHAGRQRQWVAARAQLVYLAREWTGSRPRSWGGCWTHR